jgi:putative effector of murein hydrolase
MVERTELLLREYDEINAHLRSNMSQFVNWFSFFLVASFVALAVFVTGYRNWPWMQHFFYAVLIVFLFLHVLAFVSIVTFRRYISSTNARVACVIREMAEDVDSPVPTRLSQWMTDLMAAGFVVSYFAWFSLLFIG